MFQKSRTAGAPKRNGTLSLISPSGQSTVQGCNPSGRAEAATPPARGSGDGTAPGNAGSTGWTGGTGGSHIGTNTQGATQESPTWHAPGICGHRICQTALHPVDWK